MLTLSFTRVKMAKKRPKRRRKSNKNSNQRHKTGKISNIDRKLLVQKKIIRRFDAKKATTISVAGVTLGSSSPSPNRPRTRAAKRPSRREAKTAPKRAVKSYLTGKDYTRPSSRKTICSRRSDRKVALFSTNRAGKGISGPRKKTYTTDSQVDCRKG